jgi:hypothetical protein
MMGHRGMQMRTIKAGRNTQIAGPYHHHTPVKAMNYV